LHAIGQVVTGTDPQDAASVAPQRPHMRGYQPGPYRYVRGNPDAALWAALVTAGPRGASIADLMQATGKGRTWVYERLRQLADAGRVIQTIRGHWRAALPPRLTTHRHGRPSVRPFARACARRAAHADIRTRRTITTSPREGG
jgi:hypothetical protein